MSTISSLTAASTIDASADYLAIDTASLNTTQKINRNTLLGLSSAPVGLTDSQTLTNKILTAPTINGATLSGTLSGTYTIGGTPTFPASVVTLTGSQTLTNKVLTSPTVNAPTITNASITTDAITGFSSSTTGAIYGVSVASGVIASAALAGAVNTAAIASSAVDNTKVATGFVVQNANVLSTALQTGTTTIPLDDTIPQNTEGDQYMSLAITPKSSSNILVIDVLINLSTSATGPTNLVAALFQDTTANALASGWTNSPGAGVPDQVRVRHTMAAGTVSSTTFKIRAGNSATAGTTTVNGAGGSRYMGGTLVSSIVITEYKA